jgi:hypothetical protein
LYLGAAHVTVFQVTMCVNWHNTNEGSDQWK